MNKTNLSKVLYFIILSAVLVSSVSAIPPLPTEFYGRAQSFNSYVPVGAQIKAYDPEGILCGTFTVQNFAYYGSLSCTGRDTDGNGDGADEDDVITFRINTNIASAIDPNTLAVISPTYEAGEFKEVWLVSPPLVCGDTFCDSLESCSTCSADCGTCPTGGGGGGGTGGGGGSGGGTGGGAGTNPSGSAPSIIGTVAPEETCDESWICSDWSSCFPNGTTVRECIDTNSCNSTEIQPLLVDNCTYVNQTEPINRTERPVPISRPTIEGPKLVQTCNQKLEVFSFPSLFFILLFLLIIAGSLGRLHRKLELIKEDEKLSDIDKLEKEFHLKKETYIFVIIISVIAVIVYFYHYFFFLCKENYINHLWLLGAFIVASPIIINFVIEIMKYNEDEKLRKLLLLQNTHYIHFQKLFEITNSNIYELIKELVTVIDALLNKDEFYTLLTNMPDLREIIKNSYKVYLLRKKNAESIALEIDLNKSLKKMLNDEEFAQAVKIYPTLEMVQNKLELIHNTLDSKQEVLSELLKIEEEYSSIDHIKKNQDK